MRTALLMVNSFMYSGPILIAHSAMKAMLPNRYRPLHRVRPRWEVRVFMLRLRQS